MSESIGEEDAVCLTAFHTTQNNNDMSNIERDEAYGLSQSASRFFLQAAALKRNSEDRYEARMCAKRDQPEGLIA